MLLVAVDPGLRACGFASFWQGVLIWAQYVENAYQGDDRVEMWRGAQVAFQRLEVAPDMIVVEKPQIYQRSPDPNNLVDLAIVAGMAVGSWPGAKAYAYWPHEWKGTVPKDVMIERIRSWLTPAELSTLPALPKGKLHNVLDAVGLGIHHLRLHQQRE